MVTTSALLSGWVGPIPASASGNAEPARQWGVQRHLVPTNNPARAQPQVQTKSMPKPQKPQAKARTPQATNYLDARWLERVKHLDAKAAALKDKCLEARATALKAKLRQSFNAQATVGTVASPDVDRFLVEKKTLESEWGALFDIEHLTPGNNDALHTLHIL